MYHECVCVWCMCLSVVIAFLYLNFQDQNFWNCSSHRPAEDIAYATALFSRKEEECLTGICYVLYCIFNFLKSL